MEIHLKKKKKANYSIFMIIDSFFSQLWIIFPCGSGNITRTFSTFWDDVTFCARFFKYGWTVSRKHNQTEYEHSTCSIQHVLHLSSASSRTRAYDTFTNPKQLACRWLHSSRFCGRSTNYVYCNFCTRLDRDRTISTSYFSIILTMCNRKPADQFCWR